MKKSSLVCFGLLLTLMIGALCLPVSFFGTDEEALEVSSTGAFEAPRTQEEEEALKESGEAIELGDARWSRMQPLQDENGKVYYEFRFDLSAVES